MNILIIGSCGFIGSHLYDFFDKPHFVYGVDLIKSTQNNFSLITSNLDGLDKLFTTGFASAFGKFNLREVVKKILLILC
jgi:nucleoside-diphosphate-sugar epimerase